MSWSWPEERSFPIWSTAKAAVEPVPRPRTIPGLMDSTAFSAASFFRSSWESATDWALTENETEVGRGEEERRLGEGARRVR